MPGEREQTVFFSTWYEQFPSVKETMMEQEYWQWLMQVRDEVNKVLEARRKAGDIGSALDAGVVLYGENSAYEKLAQLGDELRFVLITSEAQAFPADQKDGDAIETSIPGLWAKVLVSGNEKCVRCWQRRSDVGSDSAHKELCLRCITNVDGEGEGRQYA